MLFEALLSLTMASCLAPGNIPILLSLFHGSRIDNGSDSQPHMHLQVLPRRLGDTVDDIPLQEWTKHIVPEKTFQSDVFPFIHRLHRFSSGDISPEQYHGVYLDMLQQLDLQTSSESANSSFNLIFTQDVMLMVPRALRDYEVTREDGSTLSIGINGAAFAGTLFVKSQDCLDHLRHVGPLAILQHVCKPVVSV